MARQHGIPGEWARVRGTLLAMWPVFLAFACGGAFCAAEALQQGILPFAVLFVSSLLLLACLWRRGVRRVESYFVGARGEEAVARLLSGLSDEWHVFHDFRAGSSFVDHVVIGRAGVIVIETKNWQGAITMDSGYLLVNGSLPSHPPLVQVRREVNAVRQVLSKISWTGPVMGVLCFASNVLEKGGKLECESVSILNAADLVDWIEHREARLSENEVVRFIDLMEAYQLY